ncbi:MAG: hypothetical protein R3F65_10190 [bacterium]
MLGVGVAAAQAPLIYEGRLLLDDAVPDPWPALRFSLVDGAGMAHWETVVPPDGPITVSDDGRFVAVLDSPVDQPYAAAALDEERRLQVEVCPPRPGQPCAWVPLGPPQVVGAAPESARLIVDDLVLRVRSERPLAPGDFGSVPDALAALEGRLIMPSARVTIEIGPGEYGPYRQPIVIDREDGKRLHIVGTGAAAGDVVITFGDNSGLVIAEGTRLGGLARLTLRGDGARGVGPAGKNGLWVRFGAWVNVAGELRVEAFSGHCVIAEGATLEAEGIRVSGCGYSGVAAYSGAVVVADGARVDDVDQDGFRADWGSVIRASGATVLSRRAEFAANRQSFIDAGDACHAEMACLLRPTGNSLIHAPGANAHVDGQVSPPVGYVFTE